MPRLDSAALLDPLPASLDDDADANSELDRGTVGGTPRHAKLAKLELEAFFVLLPHPIQTFGFSFRTVFAARAVFTKSVIAACTCAVFTMASSAPSTGSRLHIS